MARLSGMSVSASFGDQMIRAASRLPHTTEPAFLARVPGGRLINAISTKLDLAAHDQGAGEANVSNVTVYGGC